MHSIKRLFSTKYNCLSTSHIRGHASSVEPKRIRHLLIERQRSLGISYDATFREKYKLYTNADSNKQMPISNTIRLKHEIRSFMFDKLPEIAKKDQNEAQQVKDILDKTIKRLSDPTSKSLGRDTIKNLINSFLLHKHPLSYTMRDIVHRSGNEITERLAINTLVFLNPDATLEEVGMYVEDTYHQSISEISGNDSHLFSENIVGSVERLVYIYRMIMSYKNKNELQSLLQDRSFTDDVGQAHYGWCKSLEYLNHQQIVNSNDQILETLEKTIYNIDLLAHKLVEVLYDYTIVYPRLFNRGNK